ncbi:fibrocystin isoform X2 [Hyla sarda]|uniref:fibrocystin isoform X2 n=1 Tax=Hyla sarda TaxID=327740 RepID=UPI0024C31813|nr:fibrocystin isoform X2 [Hyla sarda]
MKKRQSSVISMLVSQMLFALAYGVTYTAYPLVGSTAGGTVITILFNDSTMDNQHLVYMGCGGHLEVHMTSPQRPPVTCDLLLSYTPPVQCKTRPVRHQDDSYELQVIFDGQPVVQTTRISYKFSTAETPEIHKVGPSCGAPGNIIELSGRIMTSNYEDYDFNVDYIEGPVILTSEQDGWNSVCTLVDKISVSIYPIHVKGDIGRLRCKTEGSYIGSQNITFSVFNKGKSIVSKEAWSISAKQELFLYQTSPEIQYIYPDVGSVGGGTDITIRGDFFTHPIKVNIAGDICNIKSLSPQVIICTTAPYGQNGNAPYPGNRGLLYEIWVGSHTIDMDKPPVQQQSVVPSASSPSDVFVVPDQPFRARLSGFFVSPETNNYTFWLQADSEAQLFISPSQEEEVKIEVASIPYGVTTWNDHWELDWDVHWKQKSPKMELVRGKKYYIEMLQRGTGQNSNMKIGVQIHNTWLNPDVVNTYQREKHQIVAQAFWVPDIQKMTFGGFGQVRFCWGNASSKVIDTNSTADQMQTTIEDMLSAHCDHSPEDIFLYSGFEEGMNITGTEGERSSWAEPYCGRYSAYMPLYILKGSQARYELSMYHHLCFAYKGYLDDYLMVSLTYQNSFLNTVTKNLTCQWKQNENSPKGWNYNCTNLWICLEDSLEDVHRKSLIYVNEILLLQTEREEKNWYFIDEIIISNRSRTVHRIDPKPARPGGHHLISTTIAGSYPFYNLTALVANCGINLPLIELCEASMESSGDHHHVQMLRTGGENIRLEVTRLQAASPPIGGTFSVHLSGTIIPGIPVHISSKHLRELLINNTDDLTRPYVSASDFTITKDVNTCHKIIWTWTWNNMTGDLPNFLQVYAENLTGLQPSIITRVVYDGGVFIWPVFGDMLASSNLLPQVIVHVNDIPAQCSGSCSFQHLLNVTPVVRDIQYTSGFGCDFIVSILGSGFPRNVLDLKIKINQTDCTVTEANASSIVCCIEEVLPLGEHQVFVHVKPQGFAIGGNGSNIFLRVTPKLFAVLPPVIPQTGSKLVTLEGVSLDGATAVAFGSQLCPVHASTSTTITCIAQPQTDNVSKKIVRIKFGQEWMALPDSILFDPSLNPHILSISPNTSSTADNEVIFIYLSHFEETLHVTMEVTVHMAVARIVNVTSEGIEVMLPVLPAGIYNVSVIMNGIALAANGFQPIIRYVLEMYNLEPCCGSFLGGTAVTIYGEGFSGNTSIISVSVGQEPCALLKTTREMIICQTLPYKFLDSNEVTIKVPLQVLVANLTVKKVTSDSHITDDEDLTFTYHRDFTPTIANLTWVTQNGSLWLFLLGTIGTDSIILFENVQSKVKYEISYINLQKLGFVIPLDHFCVGNYYIKVYQPNLGFANISSEKKMFELEPQVSSLSPREGPLCGGTILTLSGSFYNTNNTLIHVMLSRDYECILLSVSNDMIICIIKVNGSVNLSTPVSIHVSVMVNEISGLCGSKCTLTLVPEQTSTVNSVVPRLQKTTYVLYISGERLNSNLHIVVDSSQRCYVVSWNETLVICQLEETISPGTHLVSFPFAGDGYSCLSIKPYNFSIKPQIAKFYPKYFGINGGGLLTIVGLGLQGWNTILVVLGNGHSCKVTTANYTVVRCVVPPENGIMNVTIQVDDVTFTVGNVDLREPYTPIVHSVLQNGLTLSFEVSRISAIDNVDFRVGNYKCTNVSGNSSWVKCSIPQLPAGNYGIEFLDIQRGWAKSNITVAYPLQITSLRNNIDCMEDRTLHISGTGFSPGNTFVTICGSPCTVSDNSTTATDLYCSNWKLNSSWSFLCDLMSEAGAQCHEKRNTFIHCDVTMRVGALLVTRSLAYLHVCHCNWEDEARSVPADNGTGHVAHITGLFISPKVEEDEVLIYNGSCSIAMATEAEMECEAPNQPITAQITAIRKSRLQNTQVAAFYFCGLWSENSTWPSGSPPLDGDNVTVERGRTLLLDHRTSLLNLLHIKGGKLILIGSGFVHLQAHYILISDGGELQVGTSSKPFKGTANITLYGSSYSAPLYPYGVKFLSVRNASISIHGWVPKFISTNLAYPAKANDTELTVMDLVDWRIGDQFVLCGASLYGPRKQEEVLSIVNISGTCISISPPLRYSYDIQDQLVEDAYVSLRPKAALLSRDITIQGNLTDEYVSRHQRCQEAGVSDITECPYGRSEKTLGSQDLGMVFTSHALKDEPSLVQISGVRFLYAGQAFTQSRSALSIVGNRPMSGSYIRGSVVMNSFARGISLSGISHFTVEENILYNIKGHGVIVGEHLENGIQVRKNLLIRILGTDGLSNIETLAPAAIYIRSPSNAIQENMVCSSGYGFFYHLSPEGPSQAPLESFWKNTAVSCTRSGFRLHPEYRPPTVDTPTTFQDFTAWNSGGGAQIARCGNVSFKDFKIFSCEEFGINISESAGNPEVSGSLLLGHFDGETGGCMTSGIVTPKRFQVVITNTTFVNFDRQECRSISTCSGCIMGQGGFTVKTQTLKFLNSPRKVFFPYPHCALMNDIDGSVSGSEGSHLLVDTGILPDSSCRAVDYVSGGASGRVCKSDVTFHRMSIALEQAPGVSYNITIQNSRNQTGTVNYVPDTLSNLHGWQALLLDKETYTIIFHVPHVKTTLQYSTTFYDFANGHHLYIQHIQLPSVLNISITCGSRVGRPHQSIPLPTEDHACDWFYDSSRGILIYLVAGEGQVTVQLKAEEISIQTTPTPAPRSVLRWSSPESWAGVGEGWGGHGSTIPQAGDDVIVLPNRTIVVDVALPPLRGLYVLGTLEFPTNLSNEFSVSCILIAGGRLSVGTSQQPLEQEQRIRIVLRTSTGVHCDRLNGLHVSSGVIGVYGKLQIYSAYPSRSWTRLGADIAPGNEMIALNNTVDWRPGDEVIISSSSYEAHQAELFHLRDIYGTIVRIWGRLNYWHSGTVHSIEDTWRIPLSAEVGLLSRNVQIDTDTPCSGRIMVGHHINYLGEEYTGSLELSNIEISNFGSSLFPSIHFNNTLCSSSVSSSSIHHSCGGGIRATNSTNISLHANVLYNSVGHGIHLDGGSHIITDNLLILMKQPKTQVEWVTGIKMNPPSHIVLSGNSVAGSERIGYYLQGQRCDSKEKYWLENVAHSSLHGIHIYWEDGLMNCTKISGFLSYKNYDYGLLFHVEGSAEVDSVVLVDNRVGLLPIISQGPIYPFNSMKQYFLLHNSVIVATSKAFDCLRDRINPLSANVTQRDRAPSSPYKGRVGILWPVFTAKPRQWPDFPWHMLASDGTVSGIMKLQDVTFSGFKKNCYSDDFDTCIMSHSGKTAITCPITAERIKMSDVRPDHIFYFHSPNSSTTVCPLSAECSGTQAALFKDLDGSFWGLIPPVTVFPKSELDAVHPCYNVGIYKKDDLCSYKSESQTHVCQQIDHTVVILEVLSVVTEPISPVLSVTSNFVQVFVSGQNPKNGDKTGNTFYSILPAKKISKVCFGGPTPKAIRLRLNGGQNSTRLILALFYDVPNSFYIVWRGRKYSTNFYDSEPKLQSSDQSFFSFRDNLLYVILQGDEPVEIGTNLSIHLFLYVPSETNKDLYNQLPMLLATFLRVAPSQVTIVQSLQGQAETLEALMDNHFKRKRHCPRVHEEKPRVKRQAEPTLRGDHAGKKKENLIDVLIVEIRDIVTQEESAMAAALTFDNLQKIATNIIGALQTGELEKVIPMHIDSLMVIEPTPWNNSRYNSSSGSRSAVYVKPHRIHIAVQPVGGTAGAPLPTQPKVIFLDIKGNRIANLGHFSNPWKVSVYLKDSSGAPLKGGTTVPIEDGWGNFTNLAVSSSGSNWHLIFNVTSPAGVALSVESKEFQISVSLGHDKENIFMLVILSSAASAIVLLLFVCFFFKKKKVERIKENRKKPRS